MKDQFDWGMHYFRGIAICMIVITHILQQIGHRNLSLAFFQGGTIYFLFISGYLCQYLDMRKRTGALEYYKKKLFNVIAPYLVFSVLTIAIVNFCGIVRPAIIKPGDFSLRYFIGALVCGRAQGPYWYIPFVSVLFLFSPMLVRLKNRSLIALTVIAFCVAAIFPNRTIYFYLHHPEFVNLYTYFTWTYLLGMVYARFKEAIDVELRKNFFLLLAGGILIGACLLKPDLFGIGLCHRDFAMAVQKVFFIGCLVIVLNMVKGRRIFILDWLAKCSFTIFFLHMFFIAELVLIKKHILASIPFSICTGWTLDILLIVLFLSCMLILSMILKTVLGKFSRNIVGS